MNFTQGQLLSLTGMTQDRLRHWRKEIPALNERAGRGGVLSFEDVAVVAVLSRAVDELGIALAVFAPHFDDLLAAFQENPDIGDPRLVLWLDARSASIGDEGSAPPAEACTMVRLSPIIGRLVEEIQNPGGGQLRLELASAQDRFSQRKP